METDNVYVANITTLFSDILEHTDKYGAAHRAQFTAVEAQNPYQNTIDEWRQQIDKLKLPFVLINTPVLPTNKRFNRDQVRNELNTNLDLTIDYCRVLKPTKVHIILGDSTNQQELDFMKELLRYSVEKLTESLPGITCLIEPLSIRESYYLRSYDDAIDIVKEINHPKLKIMLDTYHLQRLHSGRDLEAEEGNDEDCTKKIEDYIRRLAPYVGHVQISQVPGRDSPMNGGQIHFDKVIPFIRQLYSGSIGLEYFGESTDNFTEAIDFLKRL